MIVLWLIVFVVCCGECLGLCLLLLHSRSLSPCVSCHPCPCVTIPIPCVVVSVCCVWHVTCTVCGGWHSPTHCPAVLHPLCSSLSVPLSSTTITRKNTGCVWREEGEKGVDGEREREEEEEERSDAKTSGKKGTKREKEITTPGVPRLSPTLVLTRPKQASLH